MGRRSSEALVAVWKQRIARQRRSGLSVLEFCDQEGVSAKSFYAWRRRVHADAAAQGSTNRMAEEQGRLQNSNLFVPVQLAASAPSAAGGVRIELPGGAIVTLAADASAELAAAVVRAALAASAAQERPTC